VTDDEELRRLRGEEVGGEPEGELDVLEVGTPTGAAETLARVREVLTIVLAQRGEDWPDPARWRGLLPAWFVAACVDDAEVQDCVLDRWSLRAWVYWFQPGLRGWRWWDAEALGGRLRVRVLPLRRPYRRGALEWLLKVAA
jgi:hypothetical protein